MIHGDSVILPAASISRPGSPPGMSSSKSSKTSSLHSFGSDVGDDVGSCAGHFEEIGLEDDAISTGIPKFRDCQPKPNLSLNPKPQPAPYKSTVASDRRVTPTKHVGSPTPIPSRDLVSAGLKRDVISLSRPRQATSSPSAQFRDGNMHNLTVGVGPRPRPPNRTPSARSASSITTDRRPRSPSSNFLPPSFSSGGPIMAPTPRRRSWQSSRETKMTVDGEKSYDDDEEDEDDIPDGLILDNVPLSPRPPSERSSSRPVSASTSPERQHKDRVRSIGNGTPPVAADHGSLKSSSRKLGHSDDFQIPTAALSPSKGRAKSWSAAISELNPEAKALTEKLEEHADEMERRGVLQATVRTKQRVKSAVAELPPLRRSNIVIDPLPISKEKEAVLSRTRPSWLPPKDPAEEKRHLKEYQKMMASSIEADKKREAARRNREKSEAQAASDLLNIWEEDILKRWDIAIHEERTKALWWKGIPSRSRGSVWCRAIGNALGLTTTSFQAALSRASEVEKRVAKGNATADDERRMAWFSQIRVDVEERTWPELKIFQPGGPLNQTAVDVLRAYSMYRSDIGYVSGCHTVAALLLLNLDTAASAFIALANVLNRPLPLSFYSGDQAAQASACQLVHQILASKSSQLYRHLHDSATLRPDFDELWTKVFMGLFTLHLSVDDCTRLWDVYVFEGDGVLIHAAVALLLETEMPLLGTRSAAELRRILEGYSKFTLQRPDDVFIRRVQDIREQ
ncbi:hypothetical protein GGS21DRAFT_546059 [Xylaria nigripes]|nr:hypothetical protein GGS21DRAFT_546059 [Xylaria nigripes]